MALALHYQCGDVNLPPSEALRLTDYDVFPLDLAERLEGAERLDIGDPLSFPFEDLPPTAWSMPFTIHLPKQGSAGCDSSSLIALLGTDVFSRLTVLDAVSAPDKVWRELADTYGWPASMRISPQTFSTATEIGDAHALEAKRASHGNNPYDSFSIRTTQSKERLVAISTVLGRNLRRARQQLHRDAATQLHGCSTSAFVPLVWSGLTTIVEDVPGERQRLAKDYPQLPATFFVTAAAADDKLVESADIVVGVANLNQRGSTSVQGAFNTMFKNLRVGGTLVVCERLDGTFSSNDLLEILLDASNHNLVMDDIEAVRVPSDKSHSYAVFAFSKIGTPLR